ncbi:MAG: glycosyltransferase [Rhodothermales bacterium]
MRIVLVIPSFPKLSETFIVSKFLGLLELGWDVHVVCNSSDPTEWKHVAALQERHDVRRRVHVTWPVYPKWKPALNAPIRLAGTFVRQPRTVRRYLTDGAKRSLYRASRDIYLDAQLIALQPDLVHFEFGALAVGRMHIKQRLGCKVIVSFRGYDINYVGLDQPEYYREVWETADALHLLGEDLWQRALRRGCPATKPHALIPPAIDVRYFDPGERVYDEEVGSENRPLRILSVGRLEWAKGYEYALEAVSLLLQRGMVCEYTIVGDGRLFEAVAFARYQLGIEDLVHIAGARDRVSTKAYMKRSDVLLHPSVAEGFSNAALEAQAMQVPVVCSDAGGLPENVVDGETGFVAPRRDPEALADKLALLASDPLLREKMGRAGRKRIKEHFQIEDQIERFSRLYSTVLGSSAVSNAA